MSGTATEPAPAAVVEGVEMAASLEEQLFATRSALRAAQENLEKRTGEAERAQAELRRLASGAGDAAAAGGDSKVLDLQKMVQNLTLQLTSATTEISSLKDESAAEDAAGRLRALAAERDDLRAALSVARRKEDELRAENERLHDLETDDVRLQMGDLEAHFDAERENLQATIAAQAADLSALRDALAAAERAQAAAAEERGAAVSRAAELEAELAESLDANRKLAAHADSTRQQLQDVEAGAQRMRIKHEANEARLQDNLERTAKQTAQIAKFQRETDELLAAAAEGSELRRSLAAAEAGQQAEAARRATLSEVVRRCQTGLRKIGAELSALSRIVEHVDASTAEGVSQTLSDLADAASQLGAFREAEVTEALSPEAPASTGAWEPQAITHPVPPFALDSPVISHLLSQWSAERQKQQYLRLWLQCVREDRRTPVQFPPGVHLSGLSPEVFDGFLTLVAPMLRDLPHAEVQVMARRAADGTYDLRFRRDARPAGPQGPQGPQGTQGAALPAQSQSPQAPPRIAPAATDGGPPSLAQRITRHLTELQR